VAALHDQQHVASSRKVNELGKAYLTTELGRLGLQAPPSAANFLLVDLKRDGPAVAEALLRKGVIVRPLGGQYLPTHVRVTIGTPPENERFIEALTSVLQREGS
jgi:histidinol-phosphate aminotransferase